MDINKVYNMEMDRIDNSDMTGEEKQDERMAVDEQMREHEYARQAEHDYVDRRYGH